MTKNGAAGAAARVAVGLVLGVSGYMKLMSPAEELALVVESYRILPFALVMPFARLLPWVELVAGGYLVAGFLTRGAAAAAAGLWAMFLAALGAAAARGIPLDSCGCFGQAGPHFTRGQAMALDAAMLALTLFVLRDGGLRWSLDARLARKPA